MITRFIVMSIVGLFGVSFSIAQEKPKADLKFGELLEQVKKQDPKADFQKLRMAFTKTEQYQPYSPDRDAEKAMTTALKKEDYKKAAELAEKRIQAKYVDLLSHSIAAKAYAELKEEEKAKFHKYVYDGLLESILKSGDGKTAASAYVVIGVEEEYFAMAKLGVKLSSQALMGEKGDKFDRIDGTDQNKEKVTLFFNVTTQFRWLEDQFKKKDK
jgi:hypothetical protein